MSSDSVAVVAMPKPITPEEAGGITIVELLVHQYPEVRQLAQDIVRLLLSEYPKR